MRGRRELRVVLAHGEDEDLLAYLAAIRTTLLATSAPGQPFYEKWLVATVSDPSSIPLMVKDYVDGIDRRVGALEEAVARLGERR